MTANCKDSLHNRKNLRQPIQMQLSKKQKSFSHIFFWLHFWNLYQVLNSLKKRWPSELIFFRNYRLRETWLDNCLKSPVLQRSLTVDMLKGPKNFLKLNGNTFIISFHHSEKMELGNVSLSYMWSLRPLCKHIVCQHVEGFQTLQKSLPKYFYQFFS